MNNSLSPDQDYKLWWLLEQARHTVFKARQKELNEHTLSAMQAVTLFTIKAIGHRATPAEISRWLNRESHSVSGLLSRMKKDGLVTKVKDLDRKNMVRVELTEKGQHAYKLSTQREVIHRIMSVLSEEERQQLWSSLQKIRDKALEELRIERKPPFP